MADHAADLRKLCYHFPKKSPEYLLKMLKKYDGDFEITADAVRKDGNGCVKFFRNLVDRFRALIDNAKSKPSSQEDERNEVFEVNIGQDLANTLREKFANSTSLRVPEGFEPVILMPASMGEKLYLLYAESVFHQEEMQQKLETDVRMSEDEELARKIQEYDWNEIEEIKITNVIDMTQESRRPVQRDEKPWDMNSASAVIKSIEPSTFGALPKRSVLRPQSTSQGKDEPNLGLGMGTWNLQPLTPMPTRLLHPQMETSADEATDSYNEKARSILSKYTMLSEEVKRKVKSQQLFVPGSPLSTAKPKLVSPTGRYDGNLQQNTWNIYEDRLNRDTLEIHSTQDKQGPVTKIKSKLQQFVNPVSPFNDFEHEKSEKNSQELQSACHYRDKARDHLKNQRKYEDMAKNLLQDDRELSRLYFECSKQEAKKWEECNHLAALTFLSENLENSPRSNIIDLHHLYVKEALQCLDVFLDYEISLLQIEAKTSKKVSIITGRGKHSLHGIAKIKPEVMRRLTERGLVFEEKNPGLLKATIRNDSYMATDLARSCTEV